MLGGGQLQSGKYISLWCFHENMTSVNSKANLLFFVIIGDEWESKIC